ncbi:Protein NEDD1 [Armadillidium vulgare]|nr:Protein NEDD1 [Armadillidium vulgare]
MLNRSIVGVCGGNGYVALYDAITSKVFARHNSHSAPVSNVAFSPINELLMISVGYDKKLISYDVNTKRFLSPLEGSPRSNASSSVKSSANDSTHKIMNSLEKSVPNLEFMNENTLFVNSHYMVFYLTADDILLSSQKNNSEQRKSICQEGFLNTSKSRNHEKSLSDELQNSSADRVKKNLLKDLEIKSPSPTKNSSVPLENLANTTEDEKFEEAVRLAFPHGDCEPPGILDNLGIDDAPGTSLNINVEVRNFYC